MATSGIGSYKKHFTSHLATNPHRRPPQETPQCAVMAAKNAEVHKRSGNPTGPMRHQ